MDLQALGTTDEQDLNHNKEEIDIETIQRKWNLPQLNIKLVDIHSRIQDISDEIKNKGTVILGPENQEQLDARKAKPTTSLKEGDPLMDFLKVTQPHEVPNLIKDDQKPGKKASSKVDEETHETDNGKLKMTQYGIKRNNKKDKKIPCSSCDQVFSMIKEFNQHMKTDHPNVKFRCKYCPKVYNTYNARYKHEYKHFQLPYKCEYCEKRFQFPGLRNKHEKQHTGKGLIPCTWPGCKQQLSCNDALRQHIVTHNDEKFPCSICDKEFNTATILKQHTKGKHGEGYITLCGAAFDWSDGCNEHQKGDCVECDAALKKMQSKPEYPQKRKHWKNSLRESDKKTEEKEQLSELSGTEENEKLSELSGTGSDDSNSGYSGSGSSRSSCSSDSGSSPHGSENADGQQPKNSGTPSSSDTE